MFLTVHSFDHHTCNHVTELIRAALRGGADKSIPLFLFKIGFSSGLNSMGNVLGLDRGGGGGVLSSSHLHDNIIIFVVIIIVAVAVVFYFNYMYV